MKWFQNGNIILLIFLHLIFLQSKGQQSDEFQQHLIFLQQLDNPEEIPEFFHQIRLNWKNLSLDTLSYQANQLISHCKEDPLKEIWAHRIYAIALSDDQKEFTMAMEQYNQLLEKSRLFGNDFLYAEALVITGQFYDSNLLYEKALKFYYQTIEFAIYKQGLNKLVSQSFHLAGSLNYKVYNYRQSIDDFNSFIEIMLKEDQVTSLDRFELMNAYNTIGLAYKLLNEYEKAIEEFNKSLEVAIETENNFWIGLIHGNIGLTYLKLKKYDLAESFLLMQLENRTQAQQIGGDVYLDLIDLYLELDNMKMVETYFDSLNHLNVEWDLPYTFRKLRQEGEIFFKKADYQKSASTLLEAMEKRDALYSREEAERLSRIKAISETLRFQEEAEQLAKQNLLQQQEINNKNIAIVTGMLLLGFSLIIGFILFRVNSRIKKQRNKIHEQSQLLIKKGAEINKQNKALQANQERLNHQNKELVNALNQLKETKSQLVHSEKMASIGVLTAGLAHELNNPINYIKSGVLGLKKSLDILLQTNKIYDTIDESNYKEKLREIEEFKTQYQFEKVVALLEKIPDNIVSGTKKTSQIIKGLDAVSNKEKGKIELYNLTEGIETNLKLVSKRLGKNIEVIKQLNSTPKIPSYFNTIDQVLLNILLNAIQAIPEKGKIWITTETKGKNVLIAIKDNGRGMNEEVKNQIFLPFYTTKEVGQGTGLGLYISHEIIKAHKGSIEVISQNGEGTEFIICLPLNGQ
ncbi:tetratricopeptide repeat-containing sensor histidine kinase [Flexithrix dorotheae]|uniref:tetratricopeptide repeat-containing sensor histidine kinase n=1 Tax=Flexithrix dorotheae TaxID=70993 RepID=UPI000379B0FE|nr:ATP-binding protein [Flexithrix dorotheae]